MNTQQPTPQERVDQFRADVMSMLDAMHTELEDMRAELQQIREGLSHASAPAPAGQSATFTAESVTLDYMDGKAVYKMRGGQYAKFGVRVWPEVLPLLGIDPATLKPGSNKIEPLAVRVLLAESTDDNGQTKTTARKVIGRA